MPADVIECSGLRLERGPLLAACSTSNSLCFGHTLTQGIGERESKRGRERERERNGTILSSPLPTQLTHLHVQHTRETKDTLLDRSPFRLCVALRISRRKTRWSFSERRVCSRCWDRGAESTFLFDFERGEEGKTRLTVGGTCVRKAFTCWLPILLCAYRPMPFFSSKLSPPPCMIQFLACYSNVEENS